MGSCVRADNSLRLFDVCSWREREKLPGKSVCSCEIENREEINGRVWANEETTCAFNIYSKSRLRWNELML